jgi:hypothetical protein
LTTKTTFGVNSGSPAQTQRDQDLKLAMRDRLIAQVPNVMNTDHLGWMPNNATFHAEANVLLRAADAYGGTLQGRWLTINVDRQFCRDCRLVLPEIALRLGNPQMIVRDGVGRTFDIRDGIAIQR